MKVDSVLAEKGRSVETIQADASIVTAIERLMSAGIGALVVSANGQSVDGILSEPGIVRALAQNGTRVLTLRVVDCMSRGGAVCHPDDLLKDVAAEMTRRRQRHLPVVQAGQLCGLISVGDVAKHRIDELELETNILRDAYIAHR